MIALTRALALEVSHLIVRYKLWQSVAKRDKASMTYLALGCIVAGTVVVATCGLPAPRLMDAATCAQRLKATSDSVNHLMMSITVWKLEKMRNGSCVRQRDCKCHSGASPITKKAMSVFG